MIMRREERKRTTSNLYLDTRKLLSFTIVNPVYEQGVEEPKEIRIYTGATIYDQLLRQQDREPVHKVVEFLGRFHTDVFFTGEIAANLISGEPSTNYDAINLISIPRRGFNFGVEDLVRQRNGLEDIFNNGEKYASYEKGNIKRVSIGAREFLLRRGGFDFFTFPGTIVGRYKFYPRANCTEDENSDFAAIDVCLGLPEGKI